MQRKLRISIRLNLNQVDLWSDINGRTPSLEYLVEYLKHNECIPFENAWEFLGENTPYKHMLVSYMCLNPTFTTADRLMDPNWIPFLDWRNLCKNPSLPFELVFEKYSTYIDWKQLATNRNVNWFSYLTNLKNLLIEFHGVSFASIRKFLFNSYSNIILILWIGKDFVQIEIFPFNWW